MKATIEISMYALTDDFVKKVTDFILRVKQNKDIRVEVNGLSTQLFGDYDVLMNTLKTEMLHDFESGKVVFLLKIGATELTREKLPAELL
ncbi:MAG: hypothetical protein M3R27_16135 [Bacteroidota bacterium]|nr:hypothetical protein [Bacteroidota bacterium]